MMDSPYETALPSWCRSDRVKLFLPFSPDQCQEAVLIAYKERAFSNSRPAKLVHFFSGGQLGYSTQRLPLLLIHILSTPGIYPSHRIWKKFPTSDDIYICAKLYKVNMKEYKIIYIFLFYRNKYTKNIITVYSVSTLPLWHWYSEPPHRDRQCNNIRHLGSRSQLMPVGIYSGHSLRVAYIYIYISTWPSHEPDQWAYLPL